MDKPVLLTRDGLVKLEHELEELRTVRRAEVAERIKYAKDFGDISENAEYDEAKNEQGMLEGRILGQTPVEGDYSDLARRSLLAAHVDGGGGVLADEHRGQARRPPTRAAQLMHLARDLLAHACRDRLAVDDGRAHGADAMRWRRDRTAFLNAG